MDQQRRVQQGRCTARHQAASTAIGSPCSSSALRVCREGSRAALPALAVDAVGENRAASAAANPELTARIEQALGKVMARALNAGGPTDAADITDAELVEDGLAPSHDVTSSPTHDDADIQVAGEVVGGTPVPSSSQKAIDAAARKKSCVRRSQATRYPGRFNGIGFVARLQPPDRATFLA